MLSLATTLTFVSAALVLAFVPGPDNLFVLMQSAMRGSRAGIAATLGICAGLVVHTVAVALGVAVIFAQSDLAFTALKFVGAAYLLYLAYGAFRAGPTPLESEGQGAQPLGRLAMRGAIMSMTNPKVAIFFLAFLPQFVTREAGQVEWQMVQLGGLFILSALVAFSTIALLAGRISHLLKSDRAQIWLNRIAGLVFVGLALRLAAAQR